MNQLAQLHYEENQEPKHLPLHLLLMLDLVWRLVH